MIRPFKYKKFVIALLSVTVVCLYFFHIIYALHLVHAYPVKAQVKDVAIEFEGAWFPAASTESAMWLLPNSENSLPTTVFYKTSKFLPLTQGAIAISKIRDNDDRYDSQDIYSGTTKFEWGTAYAIKKAFTADENPVFMVPEYRLLISAEKLDQLQEIKKFTKIVK